MYNKTFLKGPPLAEKGIFRFNSTLVIFTQILRIFFDEHFKHQKKITLICLKSNVKFLPWGIYL